MALVTCPKCGAKNVSDVSTSCPHCGYNIREHFEKLKTQIKENTTEKPIQSKQIAKYIPCPECNEKMPEGTLRCPKCGFPMNDKENTDRLNRIHRLEYEVSDKSLYIKPIIYCCICFVLSIAFFIFYSDDFDGVSLTFALLFGLAAIFLLIWSIMVVKEHFQHKEDLELAKSDYEKYSQKQAIRDEQHIENVKQTWDEHRTRPSPHIQCPYCHSTNVSRISTVSRVTSITMVGLASKKIGKQWHCNNCKSDF